MIEIKEMATGEAYVILVDTPESVELFEKLVHRAVNLWPDAPAEIKEFADIITNRTWIKDAITNGMRPRLANGLQDYRDDSKSKE